VSVDRVVPPRLEDLVGVPLARQPRRLPARSFEGCTPDGVSCTIDVAAEPWTLLSFLSSSCAGCADLWEELAAGGPAEGAAGLAVIAVTRGPSVEDGPTMKALAGRATVVMSDEAWRVYRVTGGPFFALVSRAAGVVVSEGVLWSPAQLAEAAATARSSG
jgi:hypothetical protein